MPQAPPGTVDRTRPTMPPYPEPSGKIAACTRCHKPILWVKTAAGATCPIDAFSVSTGWIPPAAVKQGWVVFTGPASVYHLRPHRDAVAHGQAVYLSHFGSCPFAKEFRSP